MTVKQKQYPFAIWVIFAGLVFAALDLFYGISGDLKSPVASFDVVFVPLVLGFVVLSLVSAVLSLMRKRIGYVLSAVVSLGFVLPSLTVYVPTLSNPSNFSTFAIALSSVPILILVSVFSILCFKNAKKGLFNKKYLATPKSFTGALTAIVLIFIIAGLAIGSTQAKSITTGSAQVAIIAGASNPNSANHFSPSTITVVIGINNTVVFTNNDYTIHTITSNSGSFNSGLLNSGDKWVYTFTKPGTYGYHCEIHPFMTGTIIVMAAA